MAHTRRLLYKILLRCDQINKKQRASALMQGRNEDLVCMQHSGRYSLVRFELEMMRIPKKYNVRIEQGTLSRSFFRKNSCT
ncbi:hypothetical protein BT96DRAFT_105376 [Gymnopus androsaceus JB14]|uniref:Uncharacterized protein n=1 Tax=Gymnopus androsaceus JB14 TaxID=1447944 RepID=A0A6A4IE18_9AGAR|nr:hypothetical protein BT96DRAFT_105376 [Gymnopus androsaceus JB14]